MSFSSQSPTPPTPQTSPTSSADPGLLRSVARPILWTVALTLLLVTAIGSFGTWLEARAEADRYKQMSCLSIVYDFEGQVDTDLSELDRKQAAIAGCDLNEVLKTVEE